MKALGVKMLICAAACLLLGIASGFSTMDQINNWYGTIEKPEWNPPNSIFGPVWSTLYVLMGIAVAIIWHSKHPLSSKAITLFIIQFLFNLCWSFIFFKLHAIGWAFVEISILLILIITTIVYFKKISNAAAYLLVPYVAWVSFATVLNGTIWYLNK